MEIGAYLKRLPFVSVLTDEELQMMTQSAFLRPFSKGEVLHARSQTECLGLVMVLSGSLCASMMSDEGKQIQLYRIGSGEMCVFMARCVLNYLSYETVVEGEKAGTVLVVPTAVIERLMQNMRVENIMNRMALQRCTQIMNALERVLFTRVDKRMIAYLLQESEKRQSRELRLTHEQLARDISSAREVVSRLLGQLSAKGLVSLGRGQIILENIEAMKEYIK